MTEPFSTPDFDHYRCAETIVSATPESPTTIAIEWSDGRIDRHHPWTLRENSTDPSTTAITTRERLADIALWEDDISIRDVTIDDGLHIIWAPDGLASVFDRAWLRHLGSRDWHPDAVRPEPVLWDATAGPPPVFDGRQYLEDDGVLADALGVLSAHGVVRLESLPVTPSTIHDVAGRIGMTRSTQFGPDFDVVARLDADSQAYTGARLGPHTDLPTRETPVGLQLLHCVENTVAGGESLMVDGFAVAEHLRTEEPRTFEVLASARWVWGNRSTTTDVRYSAPVFGMRDGRVDEIRMTNTLRMFPDMANEDVDLAYKSIRRFAQLCDSDEFVVSFPFSPGDCVIFDNRRILHGREAFSESSGNRHLRGCYVDRDDFLSRLRMIAREGRKAC